MKTKTFLRIGAVALALCVATGGAVWSQPPRGRPAAAAPTPHDPSGPVARTQSGRVQGFEDASVVNYMGIPFAAPPVGDLRWRAPRPAAKWSGVKAVTAPGAGCATSEDCLYLNVHTPADYKPGQKLPVMVWIYGGAFVGGAGDGGFGVSHDGSTFARKGVVVVTFNYRLGRAGWFAHPAIDKEPGLHDNYGNLDQIAALKWVRDNIANFGGDPRNVTLFGESAGAMSTLTLMVSPEAKGLFGKAIVESGFPRFEPTPLAVAQGYGVKAQQANNITGTDAQVAAALRRLPLSAFPESAAGTPERPILIADGKVVMPMSAVEAFQKGLEAKIPLIIGGNSADIFGVTPTAEGWDAIKDRRAQLEAAYGPGRNGDKVAMMSDLTTDQLTTEPTRALARAHAANGAPTFVYYFTYVPESQRQRAAGARHLAEVQYVFGTGRMDEQGFSTSQSMNSYWAGFAKYGDPASAGGPDWPAFDMANESTMEFAYTGPKVVNHNLKARLDYVLGGLQ